mgnify:CR=1 FL=1
MRRRKNIKRVIAPDPLYGNVLLAQFINHVMGSGKKTVARRVMYDALEDLAKKEKKQPLIWWACSSPRLQMCHRPLK